MSPEVYSLGSLGPAIFFGLFLLLVAFVVVVAVTAHRRRRQALAAWAQAMGLLHEDWGPRQQQNAHQFLSPFSGSGMLEELTRLTVRNIIRGRSRGHAWLIFDLHGWRDYRFGESAVVQWTVTAMLTEERFPTVCIQPVVPVASRFHPQRRSAIKTGDDEFDRRFMVLGDPESLCRVLTPALRDHLIQLAGAPNRWYRHLFMHKNMIVLVEATLAPAVHIEDMMALAAGIRQKMVRTDEGL